MGKGGKEQGKKRGRGGIRLADVWPVHWPRAKTGVYIQGTQPNNFAVILLTIYKSI